MTVLAIDQGTSGTKAVVVGDTGDVLAICETAVRPRYLSGGGVEHDPESLLASVLETGRAAIAMAGVEVAAVSIANQGETVLAWDPDTGQPLSPALVWQDRRADALCRSKNHCAETVARRTGLVLDPYFSAPKMAWLREHLTTEGVVTTTDSWLVHRLTGQFVTDATTASRSLLTDLDTTDWNDELVDLFGLGGERLPAIVANDELVGETTAFGTTIPVGGLIVDQQAALLAQHCLDAGTAKATFGTGVFLLANVGTTALRPSTGLTCSVAWNLRDTTAYCVDGQAYTAASAIRWITDLGLIGDATDLDTAAADDAAGVMFIPALAGLAAPWWRPDAQAAWTGMTLATGRAELVCAVIEGLAAQTAELLSAVDRDTATPLSTLRVDGGLTRCTRLMQAVANLTGVPVQVYPSAHATALGAATCARLAHDATLDVSQAVPTWKTPLTYQPQWPTDRAADFRSRWRAAVTATAPEGAL